MSDYEDEMDVDGPAPSKDITFSSDNTAKGKRSAANLPVEAEDSLPWVEKYRPVSLTDVSGHQDILATINKFVDSNRLPHLLLYGPPGTGKTSTILALARRIYGEQNMRQMVLELNASDDRGIDVVREQIKTFASTKQIFTVGASARPGGMASYKLIILDEADAMTNTAQMALRRIMEKYTANTRFCIIANYTHKLSPALLSRCTRFRFSPLKEADIRVLVDKVVMEEDIKITSDATDALVKLSKGDMRRALNVLQACHASSEFPMTQPSSIEIANILANIRNLRYSSATQERTQDCRKRHCPGYYYDTNHIQLHRCTAARRHAKDCRDSAQHQRRVKLSFHHQYPQGGKWIGTGGYHHGSFGDSHDHGRQARGHDPMAGRSG